MGNTCCAQVRYGDSRWPRYKDCGKTAKFDREGKFYCGTHDPVRLKEKAVARSAKWDEQIAKDAAASRVARCAPELLAALKEAVHFIDVDEDAEIDVDAIRALIARAEGA